MDKKTESWLVKIKAGLKKARESPDFVPAQGDYSPEEKLKCRETCVGKWGHLDAQSLLTLVWQMEVLQKDCDGLIGSRIDYVREVLMNMSVAATRREMKDE